MALAIRHKFVSAKADGPDPGKVQATHWNDEHDIVDSITGSPIGTGTLVPVGTIVDYAGVVPPSGWLECAGQLLSGAAYPALYSALVRFNSNITITQGTPAVVSWPSHVLVPCSRLWFGTNGTLPSPLVAGAIYYVLSAGWTGDSFRISSSFEGAAVNTTTVGSGVHYAVYAPFGASGADFNIPDLREMVTAGPSVMAYSGANNKLSGNFSHGETAGYEATALSITHMPAHAHGGLTGTQTANHTHGVAGTGSGSGTTDMQGAHTHTFSGDTANNSRGDGGLERVQRLMTGNTGDQDREVSAGGTHAHNFSVSISVSGGTGIESAVHQHPIEAQGNGTPFPVIQPTLFIRKIIYAGV